MKKVNDFFMERNENILTSELDFQKKYRVELSIGKVSIFFLAKRHALLHHRALPGFVGQLAAQKNLGFGSKKRFGSFNLNCLSQL